MLILNSVSHEVAGHALFNNLSLRLSHRKYGLVGPNGIGKSTLAKILTGEIDPTRGNVEAQGSVVYFAQIEKQSDGLLSDYLLNFWQDVDSHGGWIQVLIQSLDLTRNVSDLSGGEWMKARLLKVLSLRPDFLILDEPSNNLDRKGKTLLLEFLKNYQGGLLLISHDRELLETVDSMIEMSNQGVFIYGGGFEFYWQERQREREKHQHQLDEKKRLVKKSENERLEKLSRQEKRMRQGQAKADRGDLPKILIGARKRRAQVSMGKLIRQETDIVNEANDSANDAWQTLKSDPFIRLNFEGSKAPAGRTLVTLGEVNWKFTDGHSWLWKLPIHFSVRGPQRWQILGKNGSGKSTLVKLLLGKDLPGDRVGQFKLTATAVAYLDQKYGMLDHESSLLENIVGNTRFDEMELRNELAFYGFTGNSVFQKVSTFSGGELLKASLAQIFLAKKIPELIILDEPTNNLDIMSIALLESALKNFRGAVLLISHDHSFTENVEITHRLDLDDFI